MSFTVLVAQPLQGRDGDGAIEAPGTEGQALPHVALKDVSEGERRRGGREG